MPIYPIEFPLSCQTCRFSPFVKDAVAVGSAQNFGFAGKGELQVVFFPPALPRSDPPAPHHPPPRIRFSTHNAVLDCAWSEAQAQLISVAVGDGTILTFSAGAAHLPLPPHAIRRKTHSHSPVSIIRAHTAEVSSLDWNIHETHLLLSGSWDSSITVWDMEKSREVWGVKTSQTDSAVHSACYAALHPSLIAVCGSDGCVKLYDSRNAKSFGHSLGGNAHASLGGVGGTFNPRIHGHAGGLNKEHIPSSSTPRNQSGVNPLHPQPSNIPPPQSGFDPLHPPSSNTHDIKTQTHTSFGNKNPTLNPPHTPFLDSVSSARPLLPPVSTGGSLPKDLLTLDWDKYSPGSFYTGASDGSVQAWDMRALRQPIAQFMAHKLAVKKLRCSPFNEGCFSTCSYDMTVKVWGKGGGGALRSLIAQHSMHKEFVLSLDWSVLEEGLICSTSWDRMAYVWKI